MSKAETTFLYDWKLKLGILAAIVLPTVTATGAFYDLKTKIIEKENAVNQRISTVEIENQRNFVEKDTIRELRSDIKDMRSDITEIKSLLIRKSRQ